MAVFSCAGAQWIVDKIDETIQTCGAWIAVATSTAAADQANANLPSSEWQARVCGVHSQATSIRNQWVGTHTFAAAACVGHAGNFTGTSTAVAGGSVVTGEYTKIPVAINDSIQFTVQLDIT
jgi:hypothetical protein